MRFNPNKLLGTLLLALAQFASATTWYVNGVTGSDSNNCKSATTACKTISHAISLASSGDTINVAAATYKENLTITINLIILGASAPTTIIDGGGVTSVVTVPNATPHVGLFNFTIRNGHGTYPGGGGGIKNFGNMTLNNSTVSGNSSDTYGGGGVSNWGILTINKSTISDNAAVAEGLGGGIQNRGNMTLNNSTVTGNSVTLLAAGGGIVNDGTLTVNNSTVSGNSSGTFGGGISNGDPGGNEGKLSINSSTISGNSEPNEAIDNFGSTITLQNSIVANAGTNCGVSVGSITSKGYNLSSDDSCNFNGPGDLNNTDPKLGSLQNNGGPTQTQALLTGSPAIDSGNPKGCTNGNGNLLKTDQRGKPRPDKEDSGGCDMGAFERQSD